MDYFDIIYQITTHLNDYELAQFSKSSMPIYQVCYKQYNTRCLSTYNNYVDLFGVSRIAYIKYYQLSKLLKYKIGKDIREIYNLQSLNLPDSQITDISPISALCHLQDLFLADNQITDISAVSILTN